MTSQEQITYLDTLPLVHALWWWIENVTEDAPARDEVFFYLRSRYRTETQS